MEDDMVGKFLCYIKLHNWGDWDLRRGRSGEYIFFRNCKRCDKGDFL